MLLLLNLILVCSVPGFIRTHNTAAMIGVIKLVIIIQASDTPLTLPFDLGSIFAVPENNIKLIIIYETMTYFNV